MKRHPSLHPLSREHHMALMLAQGVREGGLPKLAELLPDDPQELARHVLEEFERALAPHFAREEQVLAPALEGRDPAIDALLVRMRDEHRRLHELIDTVRHTHGDGDAIRSALTAFAEALIDHVRFEERELFERMQESFEESLLDDLAARLS
jgi:iron-sulfur cluster repair protein YtfE (RIC family)